jgi:hypothetical protein
MDAAPHWYYCIKHGTIGPEQGCPARDRLGPYPTREEAARALERAQERNQEWEGKDRD